MGFEAETRKDKNGSVCRARLRGEMTIYTATRMKEAVLSALAQAKDVEFDLTEVSEIDSAGLQVLLLGKREADRAGKVLRLCGHSAAVLEAIDLGGFGPVFGDAVVISSS